MRYIAKPTRDELRTLKGVSVMKAKPFAQPAPHSWAIPNWPSHVYPHNSDKGRYLVRAHRRSLVAAGALTRIGRDLVILGAQYSKWLSSKTDEVEGYEIAPNQAEAATVTPAPVRHPGVRETFRTDTPDFRETFNSNGGFD